MLVRHGKDYRMLKNYFESSWLQIQGCYASDLNYKHQNIVHKRPNAITALFVPLITGVLYALFVVGCFGMVYELIRFRTYKLQNDIKKGILRQNGNDTVSELKLCEPKS